MRILLAGCVVVAALLAGCGDGTPAAPGDQPSSSSTQNDDMRSDSGGGGY
jgi:hypothetical protein